jgi:hypothetical protein
MSQLNFSYVLVIMGRNIRIVMEERLGSSVGDQTSVVRALPTAFPYSGQLSTHTKKVD